MPIYLGVLLFIKYKITQRIQPLEFHNYPHFYLHISDKIIPLMVLRV